MHIGRFISRIGYVSTPNYSKFKKDDDQVNVNNNYSIVPVLEANNGTCKRDVTPINLNACKVSRRTTKYENKALPS